MRRNSIIILAFAFLIGCKSLNNTQKGTGVGVAGGAAAGAAIGGLTGKNSAIGALIGAAVGGSAGYLIGRHMDKQAQELKQAIPDATVERVGEGINLTFNSGLLFKINSADLSEDAKQELKKVGGILAKYEDTQILLEGHTDDTGSDDLNMKLSERRAKAVSSYLETENIPSSRLKTKWYGESQPKYPNDSEENRIKNRRVELAIYANDDMKKDAEKGNLN
ncbi:Outer membrane protein OmpA [Dyadobacter koreensis]|uniref:Outer membrane protein OmpA n=1 Tax=Dyadobacter koreensis TaxID=408657 RepID=A0A1H6YPR6_9BACT|nr:OmpA family protein [Dyadobacter koreensis]SEJ43281.1 Outer membrane protein OmpA [Dyadobacter koreensis]